MMIGLGLGPTMARGGGGVSGSTAPVPSNNKIMVFGDSRAANGTSVSGITGTSRQVLRRWAWGPNVAAIDPRWQLAGDEDPGNGTVFMGNFGIAGQRTDNYLTLPRATAAMGYTWAALHSAAVIFLIGGVNNFKAANNMTGAFGNMQTLVNYWTNPANCGGLQKLVVIIDETPIGINEAGASANGMSAANAALFRTYAGDLRGLDYRQPGGNPACIVVPIFETFLDQASGSALTNYRGLSDDGTHTASMAALIMARMAAAELAPSATAAGFTDQVSPHLANAANPTALNSNPRMTGSSGSVSGTGVTLHGSLPTGWVFQGSGTFTTIDITPSTTINANGETEWILDLAWTGSSGATALLRNNISSAQLSSAGFNVGDIAQLAGLIKTDAGSDNFGGIGLWLVAQSTVTTNNYTGTTRGSTSNGVLKSAAYGGSFDGGGDQLYDMTPQIETAQITNGGGAWNSSQAIQPAVHFSFGPGSGSARVRVAQLTCFKV